jgi:YVTN family beta-propeller protein
MAELPSGTVTFLFTDIEGSTLLLRKLGGQYDDVLAVHQRILRSAFEAHGGREVDTQGDSFFVAFRRAKDAVAAAVDGQRDLAAYAWPEGGEVRVRMGLHTGEPRVGGDRYVGIGVHKASRIGAAGHGGQVLISDTTRGLVEDELPPGVSIRELGERRLKDLDRPERLAQLDIEGLPSQFATLKTLDVELRRRRRRMYAGSALVGVLAAAIAIPVFALGQGAGGGGANVEPNSVAVIDPASNEVVDTVPVGIRPSAVAAGEGAIWVANLDDRTLSHVDPNARRVLSNIPLKATPTGVAVGAHAVWVANGLLGTVARVDPDLNAGVKTIPVSIRSTTGVVAFGEGAVWAVFGSGEVAKIDPRTNHVLAIGVVGVSPSAVAVGEAAVWVANASDNTVSRVNPRTTNEVHAYTVGRRPRSVAVGAGGVWVAHEGDNSVWRIDPASGSAVPIPVGEGPTAVAFGAGAVWVANGGDGTLSRIDPDKNEVVKTIRVGNRPSGIAVAYGAVWLTVQAPIR